MEQQRKNGSSVTDAGQQASKAKTVSADFMTQEAMSNAIGSMMEMIHGLSGSFVHDGLKSMPMTPNPAMLDGLQGAEKTTRPAGIPTPTNTEVLFEPCTIAQPLNQSLRKAHSLGTFYFLAGKNMSNG